MNRQITEIRWHGRGGQGAKTACLLLADAAFSSGKYVQGFPEYGPERMGAPITAYNRISDVPCTIHSNIYKPNFVAVVDESLLSSVHVTDGLDPEGAIIVNTEGKRFVNDLAARDVVSQAELKQPNGYCYIVFDQAGYLIHSLVIELLEAVS